MGNLAPMQPHPLTALIETPSRATEDPLSPLTRTAGRLPGSPWRCPMRSAPPPQAVEAWLGVRLGASHAGDPGTGRDVVAWLPTLRRQWQAQGASDGGGVREGCLFQVLRRQSQKSQANWQQMHISHSSKPDGTVALSGQREVTPCRANGPITRMPDAFSTSISHR